MYQRSESTEHFFTLDHKTTAVNRKLTRDAHDVAETELELAEQPEMVEQTVGGTLCAPLLSCAKQMMLVQSTVRDSSIFLIIILLFFQFALRAHLHLHQHSLCVATQFYSYHLAQLILSRVVGRRTSRTLGLTRTARSGCARGLHAHRTNAWSADLPLHR